MFPVLLHVISVLIAVVDKNNLVASEGIALVHDFSNCKYPRSEPSVFCVFTSASDFFKTEFNLIAVTFEGQKSGNTIRFNCSLQKTPPSKTIEFLVDTVSANNVRLYNGECYLTHQGSPCSLSECQCSPDGKRYFWAYNPAAKDTFTATCKAKLSNTCTVSASIQFTDTILAPHKTTTTTCTTPPKPAPKPHSNDATCCYEGGTSIMLYCTSIFVLAIIKFIRFLMTLTSSQAVHNASNNKGNAHNIIDLVQQIVPDD